MDPGLPLPCLFQRRVQVTDGRAQFARALRSKKHSLVMFYSKQCSLCQGLSSFVDEVVDKECDWLELCKVCADNNKEWAPELLHYGIEHVPTFLVLLPGGRAVTKSAYPRSILSVQENLAIMIDYSRPKPVEL